MRVDLARARLVAAVLAALIQLPLASAEPLKELPRSPALRREPSVTPWLRQGYRGRFSWDVMVALSPLGVRESSGADYVAFVRLGPGLVREDNSGVLTFVFVGCELSNMTYTACGIHLQHSDLDGGKGRGAGVGFQVSDAGPALTASVCWITACVEGRIRDLRGDNNDVVLSLVVTNPIRWMKDVIKATSS